MTQLPARPLLLKILLPLAAPPLLAVLLLAIGLGLCAVTWRGLAVALVLGVLAVSAVLVLALGLPRHWPWPRVRGLPSAASCVAAVSLWLLFVFSPSGEGGDDTLLVEHVPEGGFPRFSLFNVIPEIDQLNLALHVAPWVDRFIDTEQAMRVRERVVADYRQHESSAAFADMGSTLPLAVMQLVGREFRRGHGVVMLPRDVPPAELDVLVFLHGTCGNLAWYRHVLASLARREHVAVVCPSFGVGFWRADGAAEEVLRVLDTATERHGLSRERVFLAGLSAGGQGAVRTLHAYPDRFLGVALLSARLEEQEVYDLRYRKKPVLVVHGGLDRRFPATDMQVHWRSVRATDHPREQATEIDVVLLREHDHFVLLTHPDAVLEPLVKWMRAL